MSQSSFNIPDSLFPAFYTALNAAFAAGASNSSGLVEPTTTYAYQWWADTTTGLLKIRNAANNAWVTVGTLASTGFGIGAAAATQAEQEAGASLTAFVTPGRQQFHPSAAKAWAVVTYSGGGVPTIAGSYNITSVTDGGVGDLTYTIATDFSSGAWAPAFAASINLASTSYLFTAIQTQAAGSLAVRIVDSNNAPQVSADPQIASFVGFGDQ